MAAPAPKANGGGPHFHFPHLPHLQLPHFFGGGQQRRRDGVAAASSSSAPGASSGGPPPKLAVNFSGRWQKDRARSSSMSAAMDVMRLGGVMRQAVKLVRGCDIAQTGETFTMDVTSVIGWFKVREVYKLDGSVANLRRRDWRGGGARGVASAAAPDRLRLTLTFDDPHGGVNVDEFSFGPSGEDELIVETTVTSRGGERASFTQVYTRRK